MCILKTKILINNIYTCIDQDFLCQSCHDWEKFFPPVVRQKILALFDVHVLSEFKENSQVQSPATSVKRLTHSCWREPSATLYMDKSINRLDDDLQILSSYFAYSDIWLLKPSSCRMRSLDYIWLVGFYSLIRSNVLPKIFITYIFYHCFIYYIFMSSIDE